jgi:hypothetical protein
MILNPGEKFVIARQLDDPLDTATYYVRAYIRKTSDDSLIATVDLTDKGDQRFRGEWPVAQYNDPTYITITTKCFTNAGYTTESDVYRRNEEMYLIQQRWNMAFGGGGGGADVDYKRIKEIVEKIIVEKIALIKMPVPEIKNITKYNTVREKFEIDLSPITKQIKELSNEIQIIKNKKDKDVNFAPVASDIKQLGLLITKVIKDQPQVDFSDILMAINSLSRVITDNNSNLGEKVKKIENNTEKPGPDILKEKLKKRRAIFLGLQS